MRAAAALPGLLCILLIPALTACDAADPAGGDPAPIRTSSAAPSGSSASPSWEPWEWVARGDMLCRDGTPTGYGLRRASAGSSHEDKVMIYLQGGGACYDARSCSRNASSFAASDFQTWTTTGKGTLGIFNGRAENPFFGWNQVFVPYCTGDVHAGDTTGVAIEGTNGPWDFVGHRNIQVVVSEVRARFGGVQDAALVGTSGGAFGALFTYDLVAQEFAPLPVSLVSDSGPVFESDEVLTDSLQLHWREVWNIEAATPDGCGTLCYQDSGDGTEHILPYLAGAHPSSTFALIGNTDDVSPRLHFAYKNPNCEPDFFGGRPECLLPVELTRGAYYDFRDRVTLYPNVSMYLTTLAKHTTLVNDELYTREHEGVLLTDWLRDVLDAGDGGGTTNAPPTAAFAYSCTDLACSFDASASSDGDGSITGYTWAFGDGGAGSGPTPDHTYASGGTFTVTLTVADDGGAAGSTSQSVTVSEPSSGGDISLSASGRRVRGRHHVDLAWRGAASSSVDVFRDGSLVTTTANDGAYTDNTGGRGSASYTYQVCEAGTSTCSDTATVTF